MPPLITGPFAQELEAQRGKFNTLFAEARRQRPKLEPASFAELLTKTVTPIVDAVAKIAPARVPETVEVLYTLTLDLLGQELLGLNSRYPFVVDAWQVLFPLLGKFVAEAPRHVLGTLTNAHYNLSVTAGARPHEWAGLMLKLGELCPDSETLLKAGQVAAWRAGMAHFRAGALELCGILPPNIVRAALGLPHSEAPVAPILNMLQANRWANPNSPPPKPELKLVSRVGAFRGFGGLFLRPPIVEPTAEYFLLTDGEGEWLLTADAFGATFHRIADVPITKLASPFSLSKDGTVAANGQRIKFPELANATSHAANAHTLAVTTPLSHSVFLVAVA